MRCVVVSEVIVGPSSIRYCVYFCAGDVTFHHKCASHCLLGLPETAGPDNPLAPSFRCKAFVTCVYSLCPNRQNRLPAHRLLS